MFNSAEIGSRSDETLASGEKAAQNQLRRLAEAFCHCMEAEPVKFAALFWVFNLNSTNITVSQRRGLLIFLGLHIYFEEKGPAPIHISAYVTAPGAGALTASTFHLNKTDQIQ